MKFGKIEFQILFDGELILIREILIFNFDVFDIPI